MRRTIPHLLAVASVVSPFTAAGCAVTRRQELVGSSIDDATIITQIKNRFVESKQVARNVNGVKAVRHEIAVRP
ncbi:hypothetical protein KGA65_18110 [Ideonella sp. B7]|uniref:hypothetical protein n=1 Tax=Ideonella benzenivorans TaxID=2831643 RepID=UPI001CED4CA5|nr:hypothetical protein [Ideonella benzenivorans]MCA6218456.1 hypothetical protein [Ideonella benzenivorans]